MSGEHLVNTTIRTDTSEIKKDLKSEIKKKVDINTLLNNVRAEEKKEKFESIIFFGLIACAVLVTGLVVSL